MVGAVVGIVVIGIDNVCVEGVDIVSSIHLVKSIR